MADHTVGRVDRLVDCCAREPCDEHPQHRSNNAIGKILRQALDGCTSNARLVERLGIATHDVRHRLAPTLGARLLQRIGNTRHVFVQASLRYQRAGQEPHAGQPERQQQKPALDDKCDHGDDTDDQKEGDDSKCAPLYRFRGVAVEMPLQHADQTADPGDRMTD